ncbi:DUF4350 domain-containing protein [Hymenobacter rubidus]|uniref:DUF4350 domain-containing protein n=1 Tax=Hymenobacter rubidus TaxID=1441626 RepID=UPI00191D9661|nr:DUF4350 domain-containing protein [Hymenobacter rubidus]
MTRTFRWYLLGLLALFGAYVALEYYRPKPVDWTPTLINKDKIPYGTYVLYDQLPRLLGTDSISTTRLPIYNQLTGMSLEMSDAMSEAETRTEIGEPDTTRTDSTATAQNARGSQQRDSLLAANGVRKSEVDSMQRKLESAADQDDDANTAVVDTADSRAAGATASAQDEEDDEEDDETPWTERNLLAARANYLFITQNFELSKLDAQSLFKFVGHGNDVFVATQSFTNGRSLLFDSLGFHVIYPKLSTHTGANGLPTLDSVDIHFTNPALAVRLRLPGNGVEQRLAVDSGRIGRTLAVDAQGKAVFIRFDYGRGHFYFCTAPLAFSNYYLLRPATSQFAATALSYLPARPTWWDEYQKQGRVGNQSLLRLVSGHEALNTAWYLLVVGGLLFVFVEARRRQRIIPTLKPLPNTTLLFTRTVASLYRQGSSHALIAEKKVGLFLDYLRTRFQETSPDFGDEDFRERLSQKAGVARPRVDELLRLVNFARTAPQMNDQQLLQLSRALSDFKREARR